MNNLPSDIEIKVSILDYKFNVKDSNFMPRWSLHIFCNFKGKLLECYYNQFFLSYNRKFRIRVTEFLKNAISRKEEILFTGSFLYDESKKIYFHITTHFINFIEGQNDETQKDTINT